ncbi:phosphoglycerate kinase [Candidatus Saccharibacteria bacterium]|nr:phosphoglycerate kinase [Candidatus Saccharibacteria bacterium]MCL1962711.1 phosphoglycerate kinase [Candidatus Saccharibacteria bacterium]
MNFPYKTINDVNVRDKQVLLRADYNVPQNDDGTISDDYRVEASLPTIKFLLERGAKIVVISHLGRPKGERNEKYTLAPVAARLSEKLGQEVKFIGDCVGDAVSVATKKMSAGEIVMLENLRFYAAEEENDRDFAADLAKSSNAGLFVQDGFGVVHRAHASTSAITEFLPSVAGFLLEREYVEIKSAVDDPNRPLTAMMGGAKVSDKILLVEKFIDIADNVIIGGAMANNFLKFYGHNVASSLVEPDIDETVKRILDHAHAKFGDKFDERFQIPVDVAISASGDLDGRRTEIGVEELANIPSDAKILDIGGQSIDRAVETIEQSGTVIWNGTLGYAEKPEFSHGSARIAMAMAKNTHITSIIGGGDTADFVRGWDALNGGSFTHVSTGGGASLELMAGDTLPGIAALMAK